jgi:hypothetical protein
MSRTRCGTGLSSSSASADMGSPVPESQFVAAGPSAVGDLLRGEARPAVVLGAFPTAMYLRLAGGEVIALLTRDAVLLPLGLRLSTHSSDHPLHRWTGPVRVGSSQVQVGDRSVRLSRAVSVRAPTNLSPNRRAISHASRKLGRLDPAEPRPGPLEVLLSAQPVKAPAATIDHFLGVGPGLTPSGDDILAGFMVGAWSFGLVDDQLRTAVFEAAPAGTTDLSAALLRCACRGESIPQVSAFVTALAEGTVSNRLVDDALVELCQIGHTSGLALATGVLAAAKMASRTPSPHPATFAPAAAGER